MKRPFATTTLLGLVGVCGFAAAAHANNSSVEKALSSYSDTSSFYQAMVNTGVLGELNEDTSYTVYAPTNEAFAEIQPNLYPCFYSVECRAKVADVLRDHISIGRWTLHDLEHQAEVPTLGRYRVYAESPYVGEYTVANHKVLSSADVHGSVIYRIDGVIMTNDQLAQFRSLPPVANAVTEQTITTYSPAAYVAPSYPMAETVTEKTYVVPAGAVADPDDYYPEGTRTTTTRTTYIAPAPVPGGAYPASSDETTAITHTYISEP